LLNGELVSYGASDFSILYYAIKEFKNFQLRLQFQIVNPTNANSGIFLRFADPIGAQSAAIQSRLDKDPSAKSNPAFNAVYSGFEVQIDDNARGDTSKDFYGRFPEPDGLWKNRTGAIYKIPAGDFIFHLGFHDAKLQQYTPGPPLVPGRWFQYDISVTGNHYEVTLTDTSNGSSQKTTIFDNTDPDRGQIRGYVGIQSYPNSPTKFRDIWIRET
jgi:hypothetical protein